MTFTAETKIVKPKFVLGNESSTDEQKARTNAMFAAGLLQYDLSTGKFSLSGSVNHNNSLN